jgi:hypothetical protein
MYATNVQIQSTWSSRMWVWAIRDVARPWYLFVQCDNVIIQRQCLASVHGSVREVSFALKWPCTRNAAGEQIWDGLNSWGGLGLAHRSRSYSTWFRRRVWEHMNPMDYSWLLNYQTCHYYGVQGRKDRQTMGFCNIAIAIQDTALTDYRSTINDRTFYNRSLRCHLRCITVFDDIQTRPQSGVLYGRWWQKLICTLSQGFRAPTWTVPGRDKPL